MSDFIKYGLPWADTIRDIDIEVWMIRKGEDWLRAQGRSLFFHYKEMQKLLWPEEDHHRWSDLILKEILQNDITALLGAKDSGKTHGMAKFGLTDFWCYPEETLTIVSSTDIRSLELRVWGDLKSLFISAKERYEDLKGVVIDSKHAICTDDLTDESIVARDMRKGILCFLEGSIVDTPNGGRKVESLKPGDLVLNAIGVGVVKETFNRAASQIVSVTISDGRVLYCTPEHPILTQRGWVNAVDLKTCDMVFSAHETVRHLQEPNRPWVSKPKALLCALSGARNAEKLQTLRDVIPSNEKEIWDRWPYWNILQRCVRWPVGGSPTGAGAYNFRSVQSLRKEVRGAFQSDVLQCEVPTASGSEKMQMVQGGFHLHYDVEKPWAHSFLQHVLQEEIHWSSHGEEKIATDAARNSGIETFSRGDSALSDFNRDENTEEQTPSLRVGFGISRIEAGRGDRRRNPSNAIEADIRCEKNQGIEPARVVGVEVFKQDGGFGYNGRGEGYSVYNLEVDGHPSYSVNGVIVHNCVPCKTASGGQTNIAAYVGMKQKRKRYLADEFQFMSLSMYESLGNANSGNFKMVCAGNPIGQGDPLDIISEPQCGWERHPEPEKTETWDNKRFLRSRSVNLVGTDSPNFDHDQSNGPRYTYLTNQDSINRTIAGYGENSHQFYSQCKGVRRSGLNARRVITRELCEQFRAFDSVVWSGKPRTKVAATDAAYGAIGGDRCIGGHIEFGECNDGRIRIFINPPKIVPVSIRKPESPEDQIARWDMDYCEAHGIPGGSLFYDSTGRGSLGTAFARIWKEGGALVNPVEFGGAATDRPVRDDLFILDPKTKQKRLKLCSEHYRKFVTELWWSVRLAIESDQIRGLTDDLCAEGCMREWKEVAGGKIEVETKDETKERMGRSPDLFDWLATAVEGARRMGFKIAKLSNSTSAKNHPMQDWLDSRRKKHKELIKKHQLNYA